MNQDNKGKEETGQQEYIKWIEDMRKEGLYITVSPVSINCVCEPIISLKDVEILPALPKNIINYHRWSAVEVIKYLRKHGCKGKYKIQWFTGCHSLVFTERQAKKKIGSVCFIIDNIEETDEDIDNYIKGHIFYK